MTYQLNALLSNENHGCICTQMKCLWGFPATKYLKNRLTIRGTRDSVAVPCIGQRKISLTDARYCHRALDMLDHRLHALTGYVVAGVVFVSIYNDTEK